MNVPNELQLLIIANPPKQSILYLQPTDNHWHKSLKKLYILCNTNQPTHSAHTEAQGGDYDTQQDQSLWDIHY